jgi:putative DNA primase/helicase
LDILQRIAHALGGEVSGHQVLAPGPGHSARDRSLAVRPALSTPDEVLIFSHSGDDWRTCRGRLGIARSTPTKAPRTEWLRPCGPGYSKPDRIERAASLWRQGVDPRGTLVETYLMGRALTLPPDLAGEVIRFHGAYPWLDQGTGAVVRIPTMLAVMQNLHTDEMTAVTKYQPRSYPLIRKPPGPLGSDQEAKDSKYAKTRYGFGSFPARPSASFDLG